MKSRLSYLILAVALVLGAVFTLRDKGGAKLEFGTRRDLPTFTFYVSPSATTPQMPFWAAVRDGEIAPLFNVRVGLWKGADELQSLVLAGRGDLWLGHLEGFARARSRGAPVRLLAVTGWRKFYVVSTNPERRRIEDFAGRDLPFTPPGTPAVPLFKAMLGRDAAKIRLVPMEPKQLALSLMRGAYDSALAPEPQVTVLLGKVPGLRVVANLETVLGEKTGRPGRLPLAGIAVNSKTAARYPREIAALLDILVKKGAALAADSSRAPDLLPPEFNEFVPRAVVAQSLNRDIILVKPASEVEDEIADYFRVIDSALVKEDGRLALDPEFVWRP